MSKQKLKDDYSLSLDEVGPLTMPYPCSASVRKGTMKSIESDG